jgi:hypothetical protein
MGELWGQRAPTTSYAGHIYADIALEPGGSVRPSMRRPRSAPSIALGEEASPEVPLEPQHHPEGSPRRCGRIGPGG